MDLTRTPSSSKLFTYSIIEGRDEFEERFERCQEVLHNIVNGLSETEAHDALTRASLKDKGHEEVTTGLLMTILVDPTKAHKGYRDLTLVSRDGLKGVLGQLNVLVIERFLRLCDTSRTQVLWLLREMVRTGISNVDSLCWNLLRQAAGGDLSPRNLHLVESLLDILTDNRPWLDKNPFLVSAVVYTYLRLIEDHSPAHLSALRQREVTFVVSLLRERWNDCLSIGRDLLRLLQIVARIPEIEQLWRDIFYQPRTLATHFTGVQQLMMMRTPRRYLQSRLTPEMEKKLNFFTSCVRFGMHKRYQDWFLNKYLLATESQSLRIDLIRFIVGVIHPTNEQLSSNVIPRWAVIGWLLTTCTSPVAAANAKLALFYDWLFFDAERDNIMNIEPAILVMSNSMRSHPAVTATLLDFMCRIIPNFCPSLQDQVRAGMYASLKHILHMRVLTSLGPLFDSPKLDRDLRNRVRATFKEFCVNYYQEGRTEEVAAIIREDLHKELNRTLAATTTTTTTAAMMVTNNNDAEAAFSDDDEPNNPLTTITLNDDEDDLPLSKVMQQKSEKSDDTAVSTSSLPSTDAVMEFDGDELPSANRDLLDCDLIAVLDGLADTLTQLDVSPQDTSIDAMDHVLKSVLEADEALTHPQLLQVASNLARACATLLTRPVLPSDPSSDLALEQSLKTPIFAVFRRLSQLCERESRDSKKRDTLLSLMVALRGVCPRLGYLLIYYIVVRGLAEHKHRVYAAFCSNRGLTVSDALLQDLAVCQDLDPALLVWLMPGVFEQFAAHVINKPDIILVVLSIVDGRQLQQLISYVLLGRLEMVHADGILPLIRASLSWETWEQTCLWQLITAHGIPLSAVLPILPELDYEQHAEAMTPIMLMLRQERPSTDAMRHVVARRLPRDPSTDHFAVSVLKHWATAHEDKFADCVASLLNYNRSAGTAQNKRKRGGTRTTSSAASSSSSSSAIAGSGTGGSGSGASESGSTASGTGGGSGGAGLGPGPPPQPSPEQVLGQLDRLRLSCRVSETRLYAAEPLQRALHAVHASANDTQRSRYADLFRLCCDEALSTLTDTGGGGSSGGGGGGGGRDGSRSASAAAVAAAAAAAAASSTTVNSTTSTSASQRSATTGGSTTRSGTLRGGGGGSGSVSSSGSSDHKARLSKPKASLKEISDSDEHSTEEEEMVKPKQAKKRKKVIGSDSE